MKLYFLACSDNLSFKFMLITAEKVEKHCNTEIKTYFTVIHSAVNALYSKKPGHFPMVVERKAQIQ